MIDNREGFFSLKSKVVIVTGAAGLLGRNHVEAIAAFGGTPVLLDISTDAVSSLQIEIKKKFNIESPAFSIDILRIECLFMLEIITSFGKIDGLVNNAANNPKWRGKEKNFSRLENFLLRYGIMI